MTVSLFLWDNYCCLLSYQACLWAICMQAKVKLTEHLNLLRPKNVSARGRTQTTDVLKKVENFAITFYALALNFKRYSCMLI